MERNEKRGKHAGPMKDTGADVRPAAPKHAPGHAAVRPVMPTTPARPRPDLRGLPQIDAEPRLAAAERSGGEGVVVPAAGAAKPAKPAKAPQTAWDFASDGTYVDRKLPRLFAWLVVVLGFIAILLPSIGMAWAFTDSTSENRELAPAPALIGEDGLPNVQILSDAGTWFEDHFAYRNQLVSANAALREMLHVSPTDQVVVGTDGWLYYGGTLPDYLGQSALSERALANIAHNLEIAQDYVKGHDAEFLLMVAPNKSTLYPQHMPYYYLRYTGDSNFERLKPYLDEAGVNYIDLHAFFAQQPECLYLRTDSHWDNRGALLATNEAMRAFGRDTIDVDVDTAVARTDFLGDLESMLKPSGPQLEQNYYFTAYNDGEDGTGALWHYSDGTAADVTADWIEAESGTGEGSVLMFRDSFGNALVPYWSTSYANAAFSKLVPYNLPTMNQVKADTVVIERAERHLPYLAEEPPVMVSPRLKMPGLADVPAADGQQASLQAAVDGPYLVLSGTVDATALTDDLRIYVTVAKPGAEPAVYDAFWTSTIAEDGASDDGGFLVRLDAARFADAPVDVKVYGVSGETTVCLGDFPATSIG